MNIEFELMDFDPQYVVMRFSGGRDPFAVISVESLRKIWAHERSDVQEIIEFSLEAGTTISLIIDVTPNMRQAWQNSFEEYPEYDPLA